MGVWGLILPCVCLQSARLGGMGVCLPYVHTAREVGRKEEQRLRVGLHK